MSTTQPTYWSEKDQA